MELATRPLTVMSAPGGGGNGDCAGVTGAADGAVVGAGENVAGCAVGTLGDASAGSVVTETTGVGAGVLDAARVEDPVVTSAMLKAAPIKPIQTPVNLVIRFIPHIPS
jgi:hypothetical protein